MPASTPQIHSKSDLSPALPLVSSPPQSTEEKVTAYLLTHFSQGGTETQQRAIPAALLPA
jgi:hypothetical protein